MKHGKPLKNEKNTVVPRELILPNLHPKDIFFKRAKSIIGLPEMQRIFVLKDKLVFTMKKCMVSMAFVDMTLEHRGVQTKLAIYPLLFTPDH